MEIIDILKHQTGCNYLGIIEIPTQKPACNCLETLGFLVVKLSGSSLSWTTYLFFEILINKPIMNCLEICKLPM